jgi:hypothetical protein
MKKLILLLFVFVLCETTTHAQNTISEIFTTTDIVFYGIDFSHVKLIGSAGFTDVPKIKDIYFESINNLMVNEKEKFCIGKFIRKKSVEYDLTVVKAQNQLSDVNNLVSDNPDDRLTLNENIVQQIVSGYKVGDRTGIGIVFIMESLDKAGEKANMFVTFFDIATNKVLITERITGKPGGIGFRNYWANSILNAMEKTGKRYGAWKKENMPK